MEKESVENQNSEVRFGNSGIVSAVGALAGLGIAVGVPGVILHYAQVINQGVATAIVIVALLMGGLISLVSVFFGLVIPRRVGGPWGNPKAWAEFGEKWRRWDRMHSLHHTQRGRWGRSGRFWNEDGTEVEVEERPTPRRRTR